MATKIGRTATSSTNATKFTWSAWVKRANVGVGGMLFYNYLDGSNRAYLQYDNDNLYYYDRYGGNVQAALTTTAKYRDPNAFYHICLIGDSTDGTQGDRIQLYVNGVRQTMSGTYPDASDSLGMKVATGTNYHVLGTNSDSTSNPFEGIMSHVHYVDGIDYPATTFGSTDSTTGEWKINTSPSISTSDYGNNGYFVLKDGNSVTDQSGNSHNFTVTAGTLTKTEDCPSNVFATFNVLNKVYMNSMANANTTIGAGNNGTDFSYISATIGASSGKYYWEAKVTDLAEIDQVGVALASSNFANAFSGDGLQQGFGGKSFQFSNGNKAGDGTQSSYMGGFSANDIAMIALDLDNNKITFGRNGQWADGSGNANQTFANSTAAYTNLTAGETYIPAHAMRASGGNTGSTSYNFGNGYFGTTAVSSAGTNASGNGIFEYDVPTGYTALSTKGLNE